MLKHRLRLAAIAMLASSVLASGIFLFQGQANAAACTAPSTDYGSVTSSVSVPATATYRVWSHMNVPSSSANTYRLQIDGSTCFEVGGTGISANTWTWVGWQNSSTTTFTTASLSAGTHTLKLIGDTAGVKIDKIVLSSDTNCVPTGDGSNCNTPADTTPPSVHLTAPAASSSVGGTVNMAATATDGSGVSKVEFYDNSSLIGTDTTSPYSASWDTSSLPNGNHSLSAKAYDTSGNVSTDSFTVDVENGDKQAPTTPSGLAATATDYNKVSVSWKVSTDNTGVKGYTLYRDGVPVVNITSTSYTDTVSANTSYDYQVQAYDTAGNKSAESGKVTVKTPTVTDFQAPTKPTGLSATVVSSHQVNLSWKVSTDNTGVTGYDIYRGSTSSGLKKIASSTTTSYGDTSLSPDSSYVYAVAARDANNNASTQSDTVTVKTPSASTGTLAFPIVVPSTPQGGSSGAGSGSPTTTTSGNNTDASSPTDTGLATTNNPLFNYLGRVTSGDSHKPLPYATVIITFGANRHIFQADSHGRYAVFGLLANRYNITYRGDSHFSKTVEVNLASSITQNVELQKR